MPNPNSERDSRPAHYIIALIAEVGGDTTIVRMAYWPNAKKAGIKYPFPPFKEKP